MKLTVIGGAGVRVPLVTNGLFRDDTALAVSELALFDIDSERRQAIARISEAMARRAGGTLRVSQPLTLEEALDGASFVVSSIRVGGIPGRVRDERIALEHGVPGQETVGPGGFALALRTLPFLLNYARKVAELAPKAWLINFTNPVGIMAEAIVREGIGNRCIGVCDTPREQFLHVAEALGLPLEAASFDYVGLNHLGWIRAVLVDGRDVMPELLESDETLGRAYPRPLFSTSLLRELGLLPTEYLYYYYSTRDAFLKTVDSENTRGELIQKLESSLMQAVAESGSNESSVLDAYDRYLASRNASYMAIETGDAPTEGKVAAARDELYQSAAGYDRIALDVMDAIGNNRLRVMPVDVANQGALQDFDSDTAVEIPCAIDSNGARPLAAGKLPSQVKELTLQVKEFERRTVDAAVQGSRSLAIDAMAANPLVAGRDLAERLVDAYQQAHAPWLDYLN